MGTLVCHNQKRLDSGEREKKRMCCVWQIECLYQRMSTRTGKEDHTMSQFTRCIFSLLPNLPVTSTHCTAVIPKRVRCADGGVFLSFRCIWRWDTRQEAFEEPNRKGSQPTTPNSQEHHPKMPCTHRDKNTLSLRSLTLPLRAQPQTWVPQH